MHIDASNADSCSCRQMGVGASNQDGCRITELLRNV
jgi:hypothetical protein